VGTAGQPVSFTAAAAGSNGGSVDYTWDFGDGTVGSGPSATHVFTTPGVYTVTVTASDGVANSLSSINFVVSAESEVGTDNGGDATWHEAQANVFNIKTSSVKLNFKDGSKDVLLLSGIVPVSKYLNPTGKVVTLMVGGLQQSFTLDAKAKGTSAAGVLKIVGKMKRGVFKASPASFSVRLLGGFLESPMAELGLQNTATSGTPVSLPTTIVVDQMVFQTTKDLLYKAVAGKSGSAK
jgi:PKD repeat protein